MIFSYQLSLTSRGYLFGLPVRMGGLGFTVSVVTSSSKYEALIKVTNPLVRPIVQQEHQPPDASEIASN